MEEQVSIFDFDEKYKIKKPIRLIELFAGYGSQYMALKRLQEEGLCEVESYKISEWEVNVANSYAKLHFKDDNTDYSKDLSKQEVIDRLLKLGVSNDGKTPMTTIKKPEEWIRNIYNSFVKSHNLGSITNINGKDLEIVDTDNYEYILTYSFPCQDLSTAGNMRGMAKGSGTRSGLLWEVERILSECDELPQILLMENVTQVHGTNNKEDFDEWCAFLENKGYKNFWKDLNAKDFGVPQNRNRCYMISILAGGGINYKFPKPFLLELRLKDLLEEIVSDKYYLSDKMVEYISKVGTNGYQNKDCKINKKIARPLTTDQNKRAGTTNYLSDGVEDEYDLKQIDFSRQN